MNKCSLFLLFEAWDPQMFPHSIFPQFPAKMNVKNATVKTLELVNS